MADVWQHAFSPIRTRLYGTLRPGTSTNPVCIGCVLQDARSAAALAPLSLTETATAITLVSRHPNDLTCTGKLILGRLHGVQMRCAYWRAQSRCHLARRPLYRPTLRQPDAASPQDASWGNPSPTVMHHLATGRLGLRFSANTRRSRPRLHATCQRYNAVRRIAVSSCWSSAADFSVKAGAG
jgi:hypothetical protein